MGEYAKYNGQEIKIGSCEDMMYLRADQAMKVQPVYGSVDPARRADKIRFRFPWPGEDHIAPGAFDDYDKTVAVPGLEVPADFGDHCRVQFVARRGYNVMLPCPESKEGKENDQIRRNGFAGAVKIAQQRLVGDLLVLICECGGCGARYRLPTLEDAEPVIVAIRTTADRRAKLEGTSIDCGGPSAAWWHKIADRILAGYDPDTAKSLGLR